MNYEPLDIPGLGENRLVNYQNYGPMVDFVKKKYCTVNTADINMDTWQSYFDGVMNILRDGIEQDIIKTKKIKVVFGNTGKYCHLHFPDFFLNLALWYCMVRADNAIKPYHLVYNKNGITGKDIKFFIDKYFISRFRGIMDTIKMNNIINDTLCMLFPLNEFFGYLADTLNLSDSIELSKKNPRYNQLIHADLSGVGVEDANIVGMKLTNEAIDIERKAKPYLGFDHCLSNAWKAKESVKPKQYKEAMINIGTKPDGEGGIYPYIMNSSFSNGGIADIASFNFEAGAARTAQILSHNNVSDSGHFARLVGLNNTNTYLSETIEKCDTRHLIPITLKTKEHAKMFIFRNFKMRKYDTEEFILQHHMIDELVGKTIWVYSPITCASNSRTHEVCHHCYGELHHMNHNINIGKYASEVLTNILTQMLLSAKHIMEANVKKVKWPAIFDDYFEMDFNAIVVKDDLNEDISKVTLRIDPEIINIENEDDYDEDSASADMKESIPWFELVFKDGKTVKIEDEDNRDLYISNELNKLIRRHATPEGKMINIKLDKLEGNPIFYIRIENNELTKVLDRMKALIDKKHVTTSYDIPGLLQEVIDVAVKGHLGIMAVHLEILLSNQVHQYGDPFNKVNWSDPNVQYQICTLNDALTNNPNVSTSLMYQKLKETLVKPLTYSKHSASFIDLFFMEKPQWMLNTKFAKSVYDSEVPKKYPFRIRPDVDKEEPKKQSKAPFYIKDDVEDK